MSGNARKTFRKETKSAHPRRYLAIIGALIVFSTFVFKEAFRERLKDQADSITAGETLFVIEQEVGNISEQVEAVERQLRVKLHEGQAVADADSAKDFELEMRMLQRRQIDLEVSFDRISRLVEKFPPSEAWLRKSRDEVGSTLGTLRKGVEQFKEQTRKGGETAESLAQLRMREAEVAMVEARVEIYGGDILDAAKERQDALERLYNLCTRLSYGLYIIGWALALFGRLYGLEGVSVGD